jgi:uncharacterized protein (TIGR02466 family)|tara:strand:+ start:1653 stop:2312 length:660 start_codon:yes stop_codon:yes gene_type:complete
MQEQQINYDMFTPFGPRIMKSSVPQNVVDEVNKRADAILNDDKKSEQLDYSGNLAGNVKKEVALSFGEIKSLEIIINKLSVEYVMKTVGNQFNPETTNMTYTSWVVSQYAGDFNPVHIHDSQLSGVFFLKIPPGYEEEYRREDHYPSVGCLEFVGSVPNTFSKHSWMCKPHIGDLYLFPSWLLHQVYPFRSEGERRSMAFNIHLRSKVPGQDVGKGIDK